MALSYCGINRPIKQLYQQSMMLSFLLMAFAGPVLGGALTLAWWLAALTVAAGCLLNLWRALAAVTIERGVEAASASGR